MTQETIPSEVTIHYMSGHGTWSGGEDIGTFCGRTYNRKNGFPGYWEGAKFIQLGRKSAVTEVLRRVTCLQCKAVIKANRAELRAQLLFSKQEAQRLLDQRAKKTGVVRRALGLRSKPALPGFLTP